MDPELTLIDDLIDRAVTAKATLVNHLKKTSSAGYVAMIEDRPVSDWYCRDLVAIIDALEAQANENPDDVESHRRGQ